MEKTVIYFCIIQLNELYSTVVQEYCTRKLYVLAGIAWKRTTMSWIQVTWLAWYGQLDPHWGFLPDHHFFRRFKNLFLPVNSNEHKMYTHTWETTPSFAMATQCIGLIDRLLVLRLVHTCLVESGILFEVTSAQNYLSIGKLYNRFSILRG